MTKPTLQITKRLSAFESRFIFQGGSRFAEDIIEMVEEKQSALQSAVSDLECILGYLKGHAEGHAIAWTDVCEDIGDDIAATIEKCKTAISKDITS